MQAIYSTQDTKEPQNMLEIISFLKNSSKLII